MPPLLLAAIVPLIWGSNFAITKTLILQDRPLTAAALSALPAGLLLTAWFRKLPEGVWWWRFLVLSCGNFTFQFPLFYFFAARLPGGVAALLIAAQPMFVMRIAQLVLRERPAAVQLLAGAVGVAGVGLIVLTAQARIDPLGVLAACAFNTIGGCSLVLLKRWNPPQHPLMHTGWQLVAAGLALTVAALCAEGVPPRFTSSNLLGYSWLALISTAVGYGLWFLALPRVSATAITFLLLLMPVMALLLGFFISHERIRSWQWLGVVLALGAVAAGSLVKSAGPSPAPAETVS